MHIKVFGIQRTGTNYMYYLFSNIDFTGIDKFPKLDNVNKWKHDIVEKLTNIDKTICNNANNKAIIMIKNPYTWFTSIKNWIKLTPHDWRWGDDTIEQVFKRYDYLYRNHRDFLLDTKNTIYNDSILIRYEDLIIDSKYEIQRMVNKFNLSLNPIFNSTTKVEMSKEFTEERRKYYIEQKPTYDNDSIKRVTKAVDWELMEFYGYKKIII